jgi:hypothetical protein
MSHVLTAAAPATERAMPAVPGSLARTEQRTGFTTEATVREPLARDRAAVSVALSGTDTDPRSAGARLAIHASEGARMRTVAPATLDVVASGDPRAVRPRVGSDDRAHWRDTL